MKTTKPYLKMEEEGGRGGIENNGARELVQSTL
jgi:hypothetical protein